MRMMVLVKVFDGGRWRVKSNDGFRWFRNGKVSDVGYAKLSCRYMYCDINGLWTYFRLIFSVRSSVLFLVFIMLILETFSIYECDTYEFRRK